MRKKSNLLKVFSLSMLASIFSIVGCTNKDNANNTGGGSGKDPSGSTQTPVTTGCYYLSTLDGTSWKSYSKDDDVPANNKFVKDDSESYTLESNFEQGFKFKIGQVGSTTLYGGDSLFSTNTQLSKGDDDAIVVNEKGTYKLSFNSTESTLSYHFTAPTPVVPEKTLLDVEINEKSSELTYESASAPKKTLTAKATYSDGSEATIGFTWKSLNEAVATVDANGLVTAVSSGTAKITATLGDKSGEASVNVNGLIVLDKTSANLNVGEELTLNPTIYGGAIKGEYSSADSSVAEINQDGKVTAIKAGKTKVRLSYKPRTDAATKFAECEITVAKPLTDLTVNSTMTVAVGNTSDLKIGFVPEDTTNKNYEYSIDEAGQDKISIVKDGATLKVTGVAEGSATITVTATEGQNTITKTCAVTVVAAGTVVAEMDKATLSMKRQDSPVTLNVSVSGDTVSSVTWTSSHPEVATVEGDSSINTMGSVTSVYFGTTTITATVTTAGGKTETSTCKVTVKPTTFFLYGGFADANYKDSLSDVPDKYKSTEENGVFTIQAHLPKDQEFRIAHDDGFANDGHTDSIDGYRGLVWSNMDNSNKSSYLISGSSTGKGGNNIKPTLAGTYKLTIDTNADGVAKIKSEDVDIDVTSFALTSTKATIKSGDSTNNEAVISLSAIAPSESETFVKTSDISWTYDTTYVDVVEADDKKSITLTAKAIQTGGAVQVSCTIKGVTQTTSITVIGTDEGEVAVSTVTFDQSEYVYDVSAEGSKTHHLFVQATVNADATNKGVVYSTTDNGVSVDASTGEVTAEHIGTFTITATASGDSTKSANATVVFYSDSIYLIGQKQGVWDKGSGCETGSTRGTDYANYTLHRNVNTYTYTGDFYLTNADLVFLAYTGCGDAWGNTLTQKGGVYTQDTNKTTSLDGSNHIKIDGTTGVYTFTVDLTTSAPAVTVERKGDASLSMISSLMQSTTEVTTSTAGSLVKATNTYTTEIISAFTENTDYSLNIKDDAGTVVKAITSVETFIDNNNYFENSTDAFKCLVAGNYKFTISYSVNGNLSVIITKLGSSTTPEASTDYTIKLSGNHNNWTFTEIPSVTLTLLPSTQVYTAEFDYTAAADEEFGFQFASTTGGSDIDVWKAQWSGKVTVNDNVLDISGSNLKATASGAIHFVIEFSSTGLVSITASAPTNA